MVDPAWFRGGWSDGQTMLWRALTRWPAAAEKEVADDFGPSPGGSIFVPFNIEPGGREKFVFQLSWYVPRSDVHHRGGGGACGCDATGTVDKDEYYRPWYARRFGSHRDVADYWQANYQRLRNESAAFRECMRRSTLPPEVLEAVNANLTILKSPTLLRQDDGRLWGWEGCCDGGGGCAGSCTHVWNYAQALPHLFPALERTLRQTEFNECQNEDGHQNFRASLPIKAAPHEGHAAADGQLGGIMKVHRDWRIGGGGDAWLAEIWPKVKRSLDYCVSTWDPRRVGLLEEPHHNTFDIEFWGPNGMCSSFYLGALKAAMLMGGHLGEDIGEYEVLYGRGRAAMESELFNGEYFIQNVRWRGLDAADPVDAETMMGGRYSPEARELLSKEGPKYQYGDGCLADGILGAWMARVCGVGEIIDPEKEKSHLLAVLKYNMRASLAKHVNPQRPTYAIGDEAGLLLCSWPGENKLAIPFPYSNEVWTSIEYQVGSHLMMFGLVDEALELVRAARRRHDGRRRNPFNEYECGHWYARAMSSYALIQGMGGVRYDAVDQTLYIKRPPSATDFEVFLATATGYGTAGIKDGVPFVKVDKGTIAVGKIEMGQ